MHKSPSVPHYMRSNGHYYQSGQASCSLGRSCNWGWSARLGDDSLYAPLPATACISWHYAQITFLKATDLIFMKVLVAGHSRLILGPYILFSTCHPSSLVSFPAPTLSWLLLPYIKIVPNAWPCSQAIAALPLIDSFDWCASQELKFCSLYQLACGPFPL